MGVEGTPMDSERDVWWHDLVDAQRPYCEPVWLGSEDPLFNLYTSGSTGQPKGLIHTTAGYLLHVLVSFKYVFDVHPGDKFGCTVGPKSGLSSFCSDLTSFDRPTLVGSPLIPICFMARSRLE
jgi:acyl-coenzyme A synthetase/AMP-(fatty) acid ligase